MNIHCRFSYSATAAYDNSILSFFFKFYGIYSVDIGKMTKLHKLKKQIETVCIAKKYVIVNSTKMSNIVSLMCLLVE